MRFAPKAPWGAGIACRVPSAALAVRKHLPSSGKRHDGLALEATLEQELVSGPPDHEREAVPCGSTNDEGKTGKGKKDFKRKTK